MAGSSILGNHTDFVPYLSGITLGLGYWSCLWTILLFLVQVCGQEFTAIFPHACLGRYVWFKSLVPLDCLGNLSKKTSLLNCTKKLGINTITFEVLLILY